MKRILLACFAFAAIVVLFQNCSMPNSAGMGDSSSLEASSLDVEYPLAIVSLTDKIYPNERTQLLASGGVPPYQYNIMDGKGSVDQSNGIYTAGNVSGSTVIRVMDSHSNSAKVTVKVKTLDNFVMTPVYRSEKAKIKGYYYNNVRSLMTSDAGEGYKLTGVLFNTFNIAEAPVRIILCKKIVTKTVTDYFLSTAMNCEGGKATTAEGFLGLLEEKPIGKSTTPVFRCIRDAGDMHIVTLDKAKDCKTGYKFEKILGYTR